MTRHVVFGTGQVGRLVAEQLAGRGVDVVAVNRNGQGEVAGARMLGGDATDPASPAEVTSSSPSRPGRPRPRPRPGPP